MLARGCPGYLLGIRQLKSNHNLDGVQWGVLRLIAGGIFS